MSAPANDNKRPRPARVYRLRPNVREGMVKAIENEDREEMKRLMAFNEWWRSPWT